MGPGAGGAASLRDLRRMAGTGKND